MLRVGDLNASIAFYRDGLGMSEAHRETFPERRFTLVFMGYGDHPTSASIELTWNWDNDTYLHGTGCGRGRSGQRYLWRMFPLGRNGCDDLG